MLDGSCLRSRIDVCLRPFTDRHILSIRNVGVNPVDIMDSRLGRETVTVAGQLVTVPDHPLTLTPAGETPTSLSDSPADDNGSIHPLLRGLSIVVSRVRVLPLNLFRHTFHI
jgi:hypothetical protein